MAKVTNDVVFANFFEWKFNLLAENQLVIPDEPVKVPSNKPVTLSFTNKIRKQIVVDNPKNVVVQSSKLGFSLVVFAMIFTLVALYFIWKFSTEGFHNPLFYGILGIYVLLGAVSLWALRNNKDITVLNR